MGSMMKTERDCRIYRARRGNNFTLHVEFARSGNSKLKGIIILMPNLSFSFFNETAQGIFNLSVHEI